MNEITSFDGLMWFMIPEVRVWNPDPRISYHEPMYMIQALNVALVRKYVKNCLSIVISALSFSKQCLQCNVTFSHWVSQ